METGETKQVKERRGSTGDITEWIKKKRERDRKVRKKNRYYLERVNCY